MNIQLTLTKVTPSTKGGFINTWVTNPTNTVDTPLGTMKPAAVRYCTKSLNQLPIPTVAVINLDNFIVQDSEPFVGSDGIEHTTQWLRAK